MARTYGSAAVGLSDASWAANADVARVGARGEKATAAILSRLDDPLVVIHDVRIPIPGFSANVDHVVVHGDKVWLIDSKVWKPGRYVTIAGHTFRGWRRFRYADTKTMSMAMDRFGAFEGMRLQRPIMVVHSSSRSGRVKLGWFRPVRAKAMTVEQFERWCSSMNRSAGRSRRAADPQVVSSLVPLAASYAKSKRPAQR